MSLCSPCSSSTVHAGATVQVIDRLFNANDTNTVVTDASVKWTIPAVDDGGQPATGAMIWDATYEYGGRTGWYVGAIPSSVTVNLADTVHEIVIEGAGGSLAGDYVNKIVQEFV